MAGGSLNVSSVIVRARPGSAEAVRRRLSTIGGVEVHAVSEDGKIIVTLETESDGATTETFEHVSTLDGVLSASMIFHQIEFDPDKEI